jgi:uncharacterized protein (DUF2141 family)
MIDFTKFILAISMALSLDSFAEQKSLTLIVLVDGAKPNTGHAIASLFSSADNYLSEPIFKIIAPINAEGKIRFSFNNLKAGAYSVSVVYDENSDGELNTGLFGIPSELVGFSNNAKGFLAPLLLINPHSHCRIQKL